MLFQVRIVGWENESLGLVFAHVGMQAGHRGTASVRARPPTRMAVARWVAARLAKLPFLCWLFQAVCMMKAILAASPAHCRARLLFSAWPVALGQPGCLEP
jgi:hypothetical protein